LHAAHAPCKAHLSSVGFVSGFLRLGVPADFRGELLRWLRHWDLSVQNILAVNIGPVEGLVGAAVGLDNGASLQHPFR
jgi:hypothetical protein